MTYFTNFEFKAKCQVICQVMSQYISPLLLQNSVKYAH